MKAVSVPSALAHSDSDAGKAWSTFQLAAGRRQRADNESYDFAVICCKRREGRGGSSIYCLCVHLDSSQCSVPISQKERLRLIS
jgi:hypothetical protein